MQCQVCLAPCHEILSWGVHIVMLVWQVKNLSGGELQRVAITLALGTPADIYLIDEPSAYLDSEQRIIAAKVCPDDHLRATYKVPSLHSGACSVKLVRVEDHFRVPFRCCKRH